MALSILQQVRHTHVAPRVPMSLLTATLVDKQSNHGDLLNPPMFAQIFVEDYSSIPDQQKIIDMSTLK